MALFCGNTAWCNAQDPSGPICLPLSAIDELCSSNQQCETKTCDDESGRCVAPAPLMCTL